MTYDDFFRAVISPAEGQRAGPGLEPYRFQRELARGQWPDILDIPTGLGKTAAVTGAWLYRRLIGDDATPRRLVWCLPMRVLVEQVKSSVDPWLARARGFFHERGLTPPAAYVLMGGEADDVWARRPEDPAVLIGTQDMLLSRALMRGYGASRYRWPIDFALLHNDALWVFDEVQLMGAGLPTSAQLEAFRRAPEMAPVLPARTLWASATLRPEWLATVDFRKHLPNCRVLRLPEEDRADPRLRGRFSATKTLAQAQTLLAGTRGTEVNAYVDQLCDEVLVAHSGDSPALVILNRVARAQQVFRALSRRLQGRSGGPELLLVHSRFRSAERAALNSRLRDLKAGDDTIVVATQAVEAGVDITSRHLFTELAPWSSLVQRFGRCNRGGEYEEAVVHWLDIPSEAQAALPYTPEELEEARRILRALDSASADQLPPVAERPTWSHVLRRKDLLDLFNTEPDLSGFDVDVSPYLRDPGGADVQLFWRDFKNEPEDESRPQRAELCRVPLATARDHLKDVKRRAYTWNTLDARWQRVELAEMRPGQVLLLAAQTGGYDPRIGFVARLRGRVEPVGSRSREKPASMDEDVRGAFVDLSDHLLEARRQAKLLTGGLPMAGAAEAVVQAALWHDVGKAHEAFQTAILASADEEIDRSRLFAKSPNPTRRLNYTVARNGKPEPRPHFRHELPSMLAWLQTRESAVQPASSATADSTDLVAYLILAHHGKVRVSLRALPAERRPPDDRLFARGVWAGDPLPPLQVDGLSVPPLTLRLDVMRLGEGEMGSSWTARTAALLQRWGPFQLAWLETMVRLADWRASAVPAAVAAYRTRVTEVLGDALDSIVLYGSRARGDASEGSDIDILVILREPFEYGEMIDRTSAATAEVSLEHEVVISRVFVTRADYDSKLTPFLMNVRKEALRL